MPAGIYKCEDGRFVEDPRECGDSGARLLLDPVRRVRLSKLMSFLLRHGPWEAGLRVDRGGWVRIDDLVDGIRERWRNREEYGWVTRVHVLAVALLDPKGRFEVRGGRIRARYGHSFPVELGYEPVRPPSVLYHGTSVERVPRIMAEGLKGMRRLYVHLTVDPRVACETGARHGEPVLLIVDGKILEELGVKVYRASDVIYLTEMVPRKAIRNIELCPRG